jgi:hypothetical protein
MILMNKDGTFPRVSGFPAIVTDEDNVRYAALIADVEAVAPRKQLRIYWIKSTLQDVFDDEGNKWVTRDVHVGRWGAFENNPITGEWDMKLLWETDAGEYVPLDGSRFQDHWNPAVRARGTLKAHLMYQLIPKYGGGKKASRFRKKENKEYVDGYFRRFKDTARQMLKEDRRYLAQALSEAKGGGGHPFIVVPSVIGTQKREESYV